MKDHTTLRCFILLSSPLQCKSLCHMIPETERHLGLQINLWWLCYIFCVIISIYSLLNLTKRCVRVPSLRYGRVSFRGALERSTTTPKPPQKLGYMKDSLDNITSCCY